MNNKLIFCGLNEDGEKEYLGTDKEWEEAEKEDNKQ